MMKGYSSGNFFKLCVIFVIFFISYHRTASGYFDENFYEDFYNDVTYDDSEDEFLKPDTMSQYSDMIIGQNDGDVVLNPPLSDQSLYATNTGDLTDLFGNNDSMLKGAMDTMSDLIDEVSDTLSDVADSASKLLNGNTSSTSTESSNNSGSQQPIIVGGTTTDSGGGDSSSGGGGGDSSGGGDGDPTTPPAITCKGMTKEQIDLQIVKVDSAISLNPSNISLVYKKGMLLFCLGDFKKSGLALAQINAIDPNNTLLNDIDNQLVLDRFQKVLDKYNESQLNPKILEMANKVKTELEKKNQITDDYVNQLNEGYSYVPSSNNLSGKLDYEAELDKIYKIYPSQNALQKDLEAIYGSEAANEIINSRTVTEGSGNILQP